MNQSMTAFSVIKMSQNGNSKTPCGVHGARPNMTSGVKVSYFEDAAIRGLGYRLTATEIIPEKKEAQTRPHTDICEIKKVIDDLNVQKMQLSLDISQGIKRERERLHASGHVLIRTMLFFKKSIEEPSTSIARYGFGINGRHGLIIFGNQGVTAGHNLVNVFFHPEKNFGWAIAVEDESLINKVIFDLNQQIALTEEYWQEVNNDNLEPPTDECKRIFHKSEKSRSASA